MRQDSSIYHSFSSHTSPGLSCRESVIVSPSRSRAARSTGCRNPTHCPSYVRFPGRQATAVNARFSP